MISEGSLPNNKDRDFFSYIASFYCRLLFLIIFTVVYCLAQELNMKENENYFENKMKDML